MSGGTLTTGTSTSDGSGIFGLTVGENNIGTFVQTGGLVTAPLVNFGRGAGSGTYTLTSGTLATAQLRKGNGSATLNLNGGTIRVTGTSASPLIGSNVTTNVQAGGAIVDTNGFNVTMNATLSGSGALTKNGSGTLILSNTIAAFAGSSTVNQGALQIGLNDLTLLPTGNIAVASGAKVVFARNVDNTAFSTQSISGAGDVEFQAQANGYYTFRTAYTGTLSYTGQTIVNMTTTGSNYQGTLWLEKDNVLPNATVVNIQSGKIYNRQQTGTGISVAGITGSAGTFITTDQTSANIQKWTVTVASGSSYTYAGTIGQDGTSLGTNNLSFTKAGPGTQILTGSNSYTGGTTITEGTLRIGAGGTAGQIVGDVTANGALVFDRSDNITFAGSISGSTGTVTKLNANTLTLSATSMPFTGSFTVASGSLRFTGAANSGTVSSLITGSGGLVRDAASNAANSFLVLNGSNNYSGGTTINAGFVQLGANNAIGTGPLVFTASADRGSLNLQGFNQTVAGLTASNTSQYRGDIYNNDANTLSTLTIDTPTGQTFTYANQIGAIVGLSKIALVKAGDGTQVLSGNNLFTGNTTITGGTLQIGAGGTTGSIGGNVTANAGLVFDRSDDIAFSGTISGNGSVTKRNATTLTLSAQSLPLTGSFTLASGSLRFTGAANSVTVSSLITGSGALVRDAAASGSSSFLVLNGSNNYSGGTTINAGFIELGTNNAIGTGPLVFTASTDRGSLNLQGFNQTVAGLTASNTSQFRGDIYNNQGNALSTLTIDTPTGQTFTYANQIGALVGWSKIALVKSGSGTQILSGNNLFTGDTTITGGTLQIGAGGAAGSIPGNAAVSSGATLAFNRSDALTFSGTISGAGGLVQGGGGTLTLSASNAFTGSTAVRAGVLDFSTVDALRNTSGVTIAGGATLRYSGGVAAFDRAITVTAGSGTGTVTNSGGGLLTLSGNISKDNSVLRLTGGAFNVTGTISGATPGTSDLIVDGTSTVTLSTVNTYNGPTFVNQSSNLVVGVNNAIPNNSVVTLGNATTTGTLTLGSNTDAIGGLVFAGAGGTVRMAANQTASPQLSSTSAITLGSNASLDLTGMSTTDGLYRLISSTAVSGSFGSVTGLNSNYVLRYGTVNANEVSAQRKAEFGTITATPAAATIITGGSTAFSYTVGNVTPTGGSTLSFTSANGANVAGSSSGTAGANATSASISGLVFTGTGIGLNQTGSFSLTDANAIGSPASGSVSVNVLDHATSSLAGTLLTSTTISLGRWNYQTSTWETGTSSGLFSIFNLASSFGASLTADLALLSVSGSGNGFTTNLNTYADIAGGASQQYSIFVNPGSFLASGTQSWTFTLGMSDKTSLSGATATNPLSVTATVIVVPEPGALALAGLGIAAAAWARSRRRST